jgi:hypothetical protein
VIVMTLAQMKETLKVLTTQGLESIAVSSFGMDGFDGAIAYYDSRKDDLVTGLPSFQSAVEALASSSAVSILYGSDQAPRIALQVVFGVYDLVRNGLSAESAFESAWGDFVRELETATWTFAAVANIQNIQCSEGKIDIGDGVSVRGRNFKELEQLLGWSRSQLNIITQDWMTSSGGSSFVLFVEKKVPKTPDNFISMDDGTAYLRAARALLALRLVAPGDIRVGRLFLARPASFNVGIGGMQSQGFSVWHPGNTFKLTVDMIPDVKRWYDEITLIEARGGKQMRDLALALRSFTSIYDRYFHQVEDRVLDAITSLEALWKLDTELAFRLSFRTASLLGDTDDERASIYDTVAKYYKIRSRIVHGGVLRDDQSKLVMEDEPIRAIVRRALRAFLHLANNSGEWTLARLYKEADLAFLHADRRQSIRVAMGITM